MYVLEFNADLDAVIKTGKFSQQHCIKFPASVTHIKNQTMTAFNASTLYVYAWGGLYL